MLPQLSQQRTNATKRNTIFETAGMFVRKLRRCSSACIRLQRTKTGLRNEPNLTLCFQQELRMKAKFRPQRRAGRPAHGCYPGATGSKTIPNCEDCCNCCGEGRTPAIEPKTRSRNEANSSFLFNKGSKWKPNSVSARLRHPPDATQMQPHATLPKQNRCNPAVATRFTPIPARNGFSPSSPALPIRLARNGADTMKLNDLYEIGFVRHKERRAALPNRPGPRQPTVASIAERRPCVTQLKHRPACQLL